MCYDDFLREMRYNKSGKQAGEDTMDLGDQKEKHYRYFCNQECEYFPCHPIDDRNNFNCLFCYCPLYVLGERCGGDFTYLQNGHKDCSHCVFPHLRENYDKIIERYEEILAMMPYSDREQQSADGL